MLIKVAPERGVLFPEREYATPTEVTDALGVFRVIATSSVAVPLTGTTAETALATVPVLGNALGLNGILRIFSLWSFTNSAGSKTHRTKFNGTNFTAIARTTQIGEQVLTIIRNRGAANSQIGAATNYSGVGPTSAALITSAHDTTNTLNITFTGQLSDGADTLTLESYLVELLRA